MVKMAKRIYEEKGKRTVKVFGKTVYHKRWKKYKTGD